MADRRILNALDAKPPPQTIARLGRFVARLVAGRLGSCAKTTLTTETMAAPCWVRCTSRRGRRRTFGPSLARSTRRSRRGPSSGRPRPTSGDGDDDVLRRGPVQGGRTISARLFGTAVRRLSAASWWPAEASRRLAPLLPWAGRNREFVEKSQRRGRDSNPLDLSREESRNGSNQAETRGASGAPRDETKRAKPEAVDADAALKLAITTAVEAGDWPRAEALMAIARGSAG